MVTAIDKLWPPPFEKYRMSHTISEKAYVSVRKSLFAAYKVASSKEHTLHA